jgi:hypothetical protein
MMKQPPFGGGAASPLFCLHHRLVAGTGVPQELRKPRQELNI